MVRPGDTTARRSGWHLVAGELRRQWGGLLLGTLAGLAWTLAKVSVPKLIESAIDRGLGADDRAALDRYAWLIGVAALVAALFTGIRRYVAFREARRTEATLRNRLFAHLTRLHFGYHDAQQTGELLSRANNDLQQIFNAVVLVPLGIANVTTILAVVVVLARMDLALTVLALGSLPILNVVTKRFSTRLHPTMVAVQEESAQVSSVVEETVTGIRVVKGFAAEGHQRRRLGAEADDLYEASMAGARVRATYVPALETLPSVGLILVLAYGGHLVIDQRLDLGQLVAFNAYVVLLIGPLRMLGWMVAVFQRAAAAGQRVEEVLDTEPAIVDPRTPTPLPAGGGAVDVDGVHFAYDGGAEVLSGLDLHVPAGQRVALVGATASGKSTVAKLLPRFYDVAAGTVRLDGVDVRSLALADLRNDVGLVFEDTFLFSDTIRANIAFASPDAPMAAIERAARLAGADRFIAELPEGYDTEIGERGFTLSGGQRQRIAIARAIVADPRVLILDDATSAVDPSKEHEIRAALEEVMTGRTTIVIAHRPATIALAERVVLIDGGRIVADGTHDDLLRDSARYREVLASAAAREEQARHAAAHGAEAPEQRTEPGDPDGPVDGSIAAAVAESAADGEADAVVTLAGAATTPAGPSERPDVIVADDATEASPPPIRAIDAPSVPADRRHVLTRTIDLLGPHRRDVVAGLALVTVSTAVVIAGPLLLKYGIDHGIGPRNGRLLDRVVAVYVVVAMLGYLASRFQIVFVSRAGEGLLRDLRRRVFDHLLRLSMPFYDRQKAGVIVSRMTSDVDSLQELVQIGLLQLVQSVLLIAGSIVVLGIVSWELLLICLIPAPLLVWATVKFQRDSNRAYLQVRDRIGLTISALQEGITGVRVIQAYGREDVETDRFAAHNEHLFRAHLRSVWVQAWYLPVIEGATLLGTALVVGIGGHLVLDGALTIGTIAFFVLTLSNMFEPLNQLSQLFNTVQSASAALTKLYDLLDTDLDLAEPDEPQPLADRGDLVVDGVTFGYGGGDPVLRDVDLTLPAGEKLALVGPTGAGKSTLAKLMARLYDPTDGAVRFGGVDLRDVAPDELRRRIVVVPQEGFLFADTLLANLRIGRPDATDAEVVAALDALGLRERFEALPDGLATPVAERGSRLSAGERQLVSLARAALADPAVLVLDEATSSLDPGTEALVEVALERLMAGRSVIVIAHRLTTAARSDRVGVVADGRLAELGTHDDLIASGGRYAALYDHWVGNLASA
jgi:ATP-binding cassette subfamily B protein